MSPPRAKPPSGTHRDTNDQARLRHARDRHLGFPVGQYLQPPPMLFTRDGHNAYLGDMYRGRPAFLICGGPSLAAHDLSLLQRRGVLTLAVNNAAAVVRPNLWASVDDPGNFSDAIWRDPGITKFVPLCHMEKPLRVRGPGGELVPSTELVGDMPAVFGYRRNERFEPGQWLYEDTFNWGNHSDLVDAAGNKGSRSVFYVALRLLFYLGVRRAYLLGCDFRMEVGRANYAFEQDRTRSSVRNNNSTFRILNERLGRLAPHFAAAGFEVLNCTPGSGLKTFPAVRYEDAVAEVCAAIPPINTAGMYDYNQRVKDAEKRPAPANGAPPAAAEKVPSHGGPGANGDPVAGLTLVTYATPSDVAKLRVSWPAWEGRSPRLAACPVVVVHDTCWDPSESLRLVFGDAGRVRTVPLRRPSPPAGERPGWRAVLGAAAKEAATSWCLYFEPGVLCGAAEGGQSWNWLGGAGGRAPVLAIAGGKGAAITALHNGAARTAFEALRRGDGDPAWWACAATEWARRALECHSGGRGLNGDPGDDGSIVWIDPVAFGWERHPNLVALQRRCRQLVAR